MDDDRELLELAARSAGIAGAYFKGTSAIHTGIYRAGERYYWNPLESDSEALRLAVKLNATIEFDVDPNGSLVAVSTPHHESIDSDYRSMEWLNKDPLAATRRAIVRAAAAMAPAGAMPDAQGGAT